MKKQSWIRRAIARLDPSLVPAPPKTLRQIARDFAVMNTAATVWDWVEFCQTHADAAWQSGYRTGYEHRILGVLELDGQVPELAQDEPLDMDFNAVVPLSSPSGPRNVSFVDEQGRVLVDE